jgi:hypothetical protein
MKDIYLGIFLVSMQLVFDMKVFGADQELRYSFLVEGKRELICCVEAQLTRHLEGTPRTTQKLQTEVFNLTPQINLLRKRDITPDLHLIKTLAIKPPQRYPSSAPPPPSSSPSSTPNS